MLIHNNAEFSSHMLFTPCRSIKDEFILLSIRENVIQHTVIKSGRVDQDKL